MTKEQEMVDAHKNGQAAYHLGNAGASMARTLAHKLYKTEHEREAYIAGYLGEMRRNTEIK
jgi:methionine synthase I (cobalamin-dependent)